MKTIQLVIATLLLLSGFGCSRTADLPVVCRRYSKVDSTHFRAETGVLRKGDFSVSSYYNFEYDSDTTPAQIDSVSGKLLVGNAEYAALYQRRGLRCSKETYPIQHEIFVAVEER